MNGFLLAMELSIKKPNKFIKGFYEKLLGEELKDKDVILWFREPWLLKDRIKSLTQELKILRIGIRQLDISA